MKIRETRSDDASKLVVRQKRSERKESEEQQTDTTPMIGMSIGDPDAPGQPPEIMLAMATCMHALAALPEPTAENVLRCVHLVVLNCFLNLDWPTLQERDRFVEGLIQHIREGIVLLDQYDADHAGHG